MLPVTRQHVDHLLCASMPRHSRWQPAARPAGTKTEQRQIRALQDGGVLLVATTRENLSPSLVLELLRRIGGIIKVRPAAVKLPAGLSATLHAEHEDLAMLQVVRVRASSDLLKSCTSAGRATVRHTCPRLDSALDVGSEGVPNTAPGCAWFSRVCDTQP